MNWDDILYTAYGQVDAIKPANPELIDVRDRFRLVNANGRKYVVKKASEKQAEREYLCAAEANRRLCDYAVDGLSIQIVVPETVICDNVGYLITPYLGKTLQSMRYSLQKPPFPLKTLYHILHQLKECGIRYRGFLPRNTILKDGVLFLIDWEDVSFFDIGADVPGNLMSETNFILNWMYFYDADELRTMYRAVFRNFSEQNVPLNQYETMLCCICGQTTDSIPEARSFIENLVLVAEAPCNEAQACSILPTDCASVIADIFSPAIDAFFDALCAHLRQEDESGILCWLDFLGSYIRDNPNREAQTQGQIFSILLMMCLISGQTINWSCGDDSGCTLSRLQTRLSHFQLMDAFLKSDSEQLKSELWVLMKRITGNSAIDQVNEANMLIQEAIKLSMARHKRGKIVWENAFYRLVRAGRAVAVPGSYVLLRKKRSVQFSEEEMVCYSDTIQMVRQFLVRQNVSISGVYAQSTREGTFNTMILPYHISVLQELNIPLDEYQPHIESYLNYFENQQGNTSQCECFDDRFKVYAISYGEGRKNVC